MAGYAAFRVARFLLGAFSNRSLSQAICPAMSKVFDPTCRRCPRLAGFLDSVKIDHRDYYCKPVPPFGDPHASLLIVGLAPGKHGANRTGRPFTGDYAGDLLYATLIEYGFATGTYQARPDDGMKLVDCRIVNAVSCVPPQNKPLPAEIANCRPFLLGAIESMPKLSSIVALGRIAHESTVKTLGLRASTVPFAHGAVHQAGRFRLYDSYHCSRYNTNTRVLTPEMFHSVFARVRADLAQA